MCGIYHRGPVDQVHPEVLPKLLGGASLEASVTVQLARAKRYGDSGNSLNRASVKSEIQGSNAPSVLNDSKHPML